MRVICLVKLIPDVDSFQYDYEKNVLVRENARLILNPDDVCALAYAIQLKKECGASVEILSMAPASALELVRDLLRRGADSATLLSDRSFAGSDTYATSMILGRYLQGNAFNLILTGSRSLDGDTSHVPAQLAELLRLPFLPDIRRVSRDPEKPDSFICETEEDACLYRFAVEAPAVLSLTKESGYKLPFVRYADLNLDVDDRIRILTNRELGCPEAETGLNGSLTRVVGTHLPERESRERVVADTVDEGVEVVYRYLVRKGFLSYE